MDSSGYMGAGVAYAMKRTSELPSSVLLDERGENEIRFLLCKQRRQCSNLAIIAVGTRTAFNES